MKCCIIGNEARLLPWKFDENDEKCRKLKEEFEKFIICRIEEGCDYFSLGMGSGVELIGAEIVLNLKQQYNLFLEAVMDKTGDKLQVGVLRMLKDIMRLF